MQQGINFTSISDEVQEAFQRAQAARQAGKAAHDKAASLIDHASEVMQRAARRHGSPAAVGRARHRPTPQNVSTLDGTSDDAAPNLPLQKLL